MNVEELSMIGPNVDLETVDAIHKKRLLAFINHFVINTSSFLNKLSKSCEQRFMALEHKIQKLEVSIIILESKLNSVPGLETKETLEQQQQQPPPTLVSMPDVPEPEKMETEDKTIEDSNITTESESIQPTLDPMYMKYVKMLHVGVPEPAVRLKMTQEGVDSSIQEHVINYKG